MFKVGDWWCCPQNNNYVVGKLQTHVNKKTGKEEQAFVGRYYYANIEGALKRMYQLLEYKNAEEAESLLEVLNAVKRTRKDFEQALYSATGGNPIYE